jgi:hypothetical protein
MVYINFKKSNIGDIRSKLGGIFSRFRKPKVPESAPQVVVEPLEELMSIETFKEHYPLLAPYSYAAIVEN